MTTTDEAPPEGIERPATIDVAPPGTVLRAQFDEAVTAVEVLTLDRDNVRTQRDRYQQHVERLTNDLRIIADRLADEAKSRGWCSEYESFCREVNGRTSDEWLQPVMVDEVRRYVVEVAINASRDVISELFDEVRGNLRGINDLDYDASYESMRVDVSVQS